MWKSLKTNKFNKKNRKLSKSHKKGGKPPLAPIELECPLCFSYDPSDETNILINTHTGVRCSNCIDELVRVQCNDAMERPIRWLSREPNFIRDGEIDQIGYSNNFLFNILNKETSDILRHSIENIRKPTELLNYTAKPDLIRTPHGLEIVSICPRCLYGQISNLACQNLLTHHCEMEINRQTREEIGISDNSCVRCGFITKFIYHYPSFVHGFDECNACMIPEEAEKLVELFDSHFPNWQSQTIAHLPPIDPQRTLAIERLQPQYLANKLEGHLNRILRPEIAKEMALPMEHRAIVQSKRRVHCRNAKEALIEFVKLPYGNKEV